MLKAIMLRKKLSEVTKKLTEAREKAKELATRGTGSRAVREGQGRK